MRKISVLLVLSALLLVNCKKEEKTKVIENQEEKVDQVKVPDLEFFGEKMDFDTFLDAKTMSEKFSKLSKTDTIDATFKATVNEVCQAKGCWMILDLGNEVTTRVKFKDYAFFVPKDLSGKEVIVNGKAFANEVPVDELRHYAEDAGKSKEEIEKITEAELKYSFLADGVLLVK